MGEGITGPPNIYGAGLDFDYSVWTPGTKIDLVNVPWNNDYRDAVKFTSQNDLTKYIDSLQSAGIRIENLTYAKPNEDVYLSIPYNRANRYNYLRASNPLMPIEGDIQKDYYYFILNSEQVNPTVTKLRLQLDVFQTYIYDANFGNCYVERGHIGIANDNAFNNYGRDYLTVPEGLDTGGEYQIIHGLAETYIEASSADIIAVSTVDLIASGGTASAPVLISAPGTTFQMLPSGASIYHWNNAVNFRNWMVANSAKPWVTQGIIAVYVVPNIQEYHPAFVPNPDSDAEIIGAGAAGPPTAVIKSMWNNWRDNFKNYIPPRYRHLEKFLTSPYLFIEVTAYTGNTLLIKPEMWKSKDATFEKRASFFPPNQRVVFSPRGYNYGGDNDEISGSPSYSEHVNFSLQVTNFPTVPVVNNGQIGYLAANANQIAFQRQSADWSQQRALGMAQGQYDVSTGAIRTAQELANIGINADVLQTANMNRTIAAQAIANGIGGAFGGGVAGAAFGPAGAALGAGAAGASGIANGISTGIQTGANDEALAVRNSQASQTVGAQNRQSELSRDTNIDLARFAARGDYANTIAGINAKVQDAQLIQPSTSGNFGGESFNLIWSFGAFYIKWKTLDEAHYRLIGEYWLRYGYAVRAFIKPPQSLHVMSKFTYWKMSETYIVGAPMPESHKQALRGMFEKGITLWANPNEIGQIDLADNHPLEGISY